jgi:hypothetical protein
MPRPSDVAKPSPLYGGVSIQSFSEYLATLGLFLTLCIAGMLTFVLIRLIEAHFPGTSQLAYWPLGIGIFVAAYFAYGQIRLAPLLTPVLFLAMLWLCRAVVSQPAPASHLHEQRTHSSPRPAR